MTGDRPSHKPTQQPSLVIPVDKNQFGEFVSSLLGEQRSSEKIYEEPFKVTKDDLRTLSDIIMQRVNSQQRATLASFRSKIYYDDGKIQSETSLESFLNLNDFHPSRPIKAILDWTFLVQFPNAAFPEKQIISASFDVDKSSTKIASKLHFRRGFLNDFVRYVGEIDLKPEIKLRVDYTEFTWGTDVLRHVDDQIRTKIRQVSKLKSALQTLSGNMLPFLLTMLITGTVFLSDFFNRDSLESVSVEEFLKNPMLSGTFEQQISTKLDFLVGKQRAIRAISLIHVFTTAFAGLMVAILLLLFAKEQTRSHLIFNNAAENHFKQSEEYASKSRLAKLLAIVLALAVGIAGNFGTELIKRTFGIL